MDSTNTNLLTPDNQDDCWIGDYDNPQLTEQGYLTCDAIAELADNLLLQGDITRGQHYDIIVSLIDGYPYPAIKYLKQLGVI
jgi:hypothetical protein